MRSRALAGLAALALGGLALARPASAANLLTTIDLNYAYTQKNEAGDVEANATYSQKYEIKYETSLTSAIDFLGTVRLELQDQWEMTTANTSRAAPTLEMQAKSSQASLRVAYEGSISTTEAFEEKGEVVTYANGLSADLLMTPPQWPELKLKYQRRREFQRAAKDESTESVDLSFLKDIYGVRLDLSVKHERTDAILPESTVSENASWTGKASYKTILYGGTEFELTYETGQSRSEDRTRDVFTGSTEASTRQLRTRFKNSLTLSQNMTLGLSWEHGFQQDLLVLDFDYKVEDKYAASLRWDPRDWVKFTVEASRDTTLKVNDVGLEDERNFTDTLKASVDLEPVSWLRLGGKVESKNAQVIQPDTGGSVDVDQDNTYEVVAKHTIGEFWELTLNSSGGETRVDGWLTKRESKLKGDLKLKYLDLSVQPSYEASRTTEWEDAIDEPSTQTQTRDAKIAFEYKLKLVNLLEATFAHSYNAKYEYELDEVLNFERTLEFNEDTRISVAIAELVRGLRLEGEIGRKASDVEDDAEPELIEVSYALKLDWRFDYFGFSSSFRYNDKGETFDDLSLNTKIDWKGERLDLSGEYQFDKIFSDLTDESRKLNLKLAYKF